MADPTSRRERIRFGAFELDVRAGELRKHDIRIKLQVQPFQILLLLLERRGEVVTREELRQRIWPADTFVDFDHGLYNAIKRLREALGDSADSPRYIETLSRRGYRFIGRVESAALSPVSISPEAAAAPEASARRRLHLVLAFSATAVLVLASFAVYSWRSRTAGQASAPSLRLTRLTFSSSENPVDFAALSPDGRYIAYVDLTGIHVRLIQTGDVKSIALPDESSPEASPPDPALRPPVAWYPDSARLLATSRTGPTMWAVTVVTGSAQRLGDGGFGSSVSPDGSLIAFLRGESEIWLMGPKGEEPHRFATAEEGTRFGRAIWSPDSRRIAYLKIYDRPEGMRCSMESRALEGGDPVVLLTDGKLCQDQAQGWWWAPDGRLFFSLEEPGKDKEFNLWEMPVDSSTGKATGPPQRITNWGGSYLTGVSGSTDGRRLTFIRFTSPASTYVAQLTRNGATGVEGLRRLTPEEESGWPTAWSSDSRTVFFYSNLNGTNDIFRQALDQTTPTAVVSGPGEQLAPCLSPDGKFLVYLDIPTLKDLGPATPIRIMRIPVFGGPPELLLMIKGLEGHTCSRLPANLCALGQLNADNRRIRFLAFDPQRTATPGAPQAALGPELMSLDVNPAQHFNWNLSYDGTQIAFLQTDPRNGKIQFFSLTGARPVELTVQGWSDLVGLNYSADGRSVFTTSRSLEGRTLLQVDLTGHARVLWKQRGNTQTWGIAAPDGRHIAILGMALEGDVWMAENF